MNLNPRQKKSINEWEKGQYYENALLRRILPTLKKKYGKNIWLYKANDHCQVGIPDLIICFYGHFVAVELKRKLKRLPKWLAIKTGESNDRRAETYGDRDATPLQRYNLSLINQAGGTAFVGRDSTEIIEKFQDLKESLGFI